MKITAGTLFASVTTTAVLAGAAGALATAATTSQASPQAIAAAVQQVQDRKAEKYLRTVGLELLNLDPHTESVTNAIQAASTGQIAELAKMKADLLQICFNTSTNLSQTTTCAATR